MAIAYYCDLCGEQTGHDDLRYISMRKEDGTACTPEVECCVKCMNKFREILKGDM